MRLISAYRAYRALSAEQKQVLKDKRLEGERTPQDWLGLLWGLAEYDREADAVRTQASVVMIVGPILTFLALVFGGAMLSPDGPPFLLAVLVTAAVAIPAVAVFIATRRADLADQLRRIVVPFIALIGDDMAPGRTLRLRLDLRGGAVKDKLREKLPKYQKAGRTIRESVYADPWMDGSASLDDSAQLHWRLDDEVHQYRISKRNARGKTKMKTKYKVRTLLDFALKLPAAGYRLREPGTETGDGTQVRSDDKWIRLRGRARRVQKGLSPDTPALDAVLETLTGLYGRVEPIAKQETHHA